MVNIQEFQICLNSVWNFGVQLIRKGPYVVHCFPTTRVKFALVFELSAMKFREHLLAMIYR